MAKKGKEAALRRKQLMLGLLATGLCLVVLLGLALMLPDQPGTVPETTGDSPTDMPATSESSLEANPYEPEDFQYEGEYLTCLAGESRLGVDVSSHQGEVDWEQVAASGVEFAMIRLGYRGYSSGVLKVDEYARENLEQAVQAGLDVGVYFFSQAVNEEEARQEAEFVLTVLEDRLLNLPVVFDWEYVSGEARTGNMDGVTLTACAQAFCETVERSGYQAMVYFNQHMAQQWLDLETLQVYPFWLAMYTEEMDCPYRVRMWQYTEAGSVPGINGNVDLNLWLE